MNRGVPAKEVRMSKQLRSIEFLKSPFCRASKSSLFSVVSLILVASASMTGAGDRKTVEFEGKQ